MKIMEKVDVDPLPYLHFYGGDEPPTLSSFLLGILALNHDNIGG